MFRTSLQEQEPSRVIEGARTFGIILRQEETSGEAQQKKNLKEQKSKYNSSAMAILKTQKVRSIWSSILAPDAPPSLKNNLKHSG